MGVFVEHSAIGAVIDEFLDDPSDGRVRCVVFGSCHHHLSHGVVVGTA